MIVVVCPGQGSQAPGFLTPWLEVEGFRNRLESISDAVGIDLIEHGTRSDAETIKDTAIAQPLIVAAGLGTMSALFAGGRRKKIGGIAGHSVGEVTAAAGAGIFSDTDAVSFVSERAQAMAAAAALTPTGMSAVLGADPDELGARLDELGLEPANYNGGGQIVVAGLLDALETLRENPPARARVIPLKVAGAFHTRYMLPARQRLAAFAPRVSVTDPSLRIWTNNDGSQVAEGREFLDLLVGQVAAPVRWDRCMEAFLEAGATGIIELAPAGALVGLAKRGLKSVPALAITSPEDLPAAFAMIDGQ